MKIETKNLIALAVPEDKFYLENLYIYYSALFRTHIDVSEDTLKYPLASNLTIQVLNRIYNKYKRPSAKALIIIIQNTRKRSEGVRLMRRKSS